MKTIDTPPDLEAHLTAFDKQEATVQKILNQLRDIECRIIQTKESIPSWKKHFPFLLRREYGLLDSLRDEEQALNKALKVARRKLLEAETTCQEQIERQLKEWADPMLEEELDLREEVARLQEGFGDLRNTYENLLLEVKRYHQGLKVAQRMGVTDPGEVMLDAFAILQGCGMEADRVLERYNRKVDLAEGRFHNVRHFIQQQPSRLEGTKNHGKLIQSLESLNLKELLPRFEQLEREVRRFLDMDCFQTAEQLSRIERKLDEAHHAYIHKHWTWHSRQVHESVA